MPKLIFLTLVAGTILVYWPATRNGFVNYDDDEYVTANPWVQEGLTPDGVQWAFTTWHFSNWHPLTWLSHMAVYEFFGSDPWAHHLTNVLLHAAAVGALFCAFFSMTGDAWPSAVVAGLFAVHPLHVESVAWIAERKGVLSTFFWMLTILAYAHYARRPSAVRYVLVAVAMVLGLMAKQTLITLPLVLLLLDYWPLSRIRCDQPSPDGDLAASAFARRPVSVLVWEKVPLLVLAAGFAVVAYVAQQRGGALEWFSALPLDARLANSTVAYVAYLSNALYPRDLAAAYPQPPAALPAWAWLGSAALLAAVTVVFLRRRRDRRYLIVGWLWYLVTLLPVIGLVPIGWHWRADRYTDVPLVGIYVLATWGIRDLACRHHWRRMPLAGVAGLTLILLAICSRLQMRYWSDSITLFERALTVTRDNYIARNNLGLALAVENNLSQAAEHFQAALHVRPDYVVARNNLGMVLDQQNRLDEAAAEFARALEQRPDFWLAHKNLGAVLAKQGKLDAALDHFRKAERLAPEHSGNHFNLARAYAEKRQYELAERQYRRALELQPDHVEAEFGLANVLEQTSRPADAMTYYRRVLRSRSGWLAAELRLAWLLATCPQSEQRNGGEAISLATRVAQETRYANPAVLDVLAAAYAETGTFETAIELATRARDLARQRRDSALVTEIEARLELYRKHRPFHLH